MYEISLLLAYEATSNLPTNNVEVITERGITSGAALKSNEPAVIPVLRSGLIMADGFRHALPQAVIGHIGIHQSKQTRQMTEYMASLPSPEDRLFIILDPVIATGDTACRAIEILLEHGVAASNIIFVAFIASESGKNRVLSEHPEIRICCASIDAGIDNNGTGLNASFQVVPGIGSVSKKIFGFQTESLPS